MTVHPLEGLLLQGFRHDVVRLLTRGIVGVFAGEIAQHMVGITLILLTTGTKDCTQILILTVGLCRPLFDVLHHALQILQTVFVGFHLIVAQVLGLTAGVLGTSFVTAPPQTAVAFQHLRHFCPQGLLLLGGVLELRTVLITPLDGPLVVVVDTGEETFLTDLVLRLGHVVETGIVHDARRVTVFLYPGLVAQFLHRCGLRGNHIMAQTEGVAYLMTADKADQLSHQLVGEIHRLCFLVERAALCHIPFLHQVHHIVIPADMGLDDLTAAGVDDAWSVGILCL